MLVALAGLPGTGKSTLARRLAALLDGVVLDKDQVRATLFPAPVLNYSREQDDLCMRAIYQAAELILSNRPEQVVLLDGRTFLRPYQVHDLFQLASRLGQLPAVIECHCADDVARQRLEDDLARGEHPARNRTFALYQQVQANVTPLTFPHLRLDTGCLTLEESARRSLLYLGRQAIAGLSLGNE